MRCSSTLPLGGNSNNGSIDGAFARNFNNDASNANWNRRGRDYVLKIKNLKSTGECLGTKIAQLMFSGFTKTSRQRI